MFFFFKLCFSIKKSSKVTDGVLYELTVQDLRSEDGGTYTCTAKNNFGQDQMIFHLLVQGALLFLFLGLLMVELIGYLIIRKPITILL